MLEADAGKKFDHYQSSMARYSSVRSKSPRGWSIYVGAAAFVSLLLLLVWCFVNPSSSKEPSDIDTFSLEEVVRDAAPFLRNDTEKVTFYDDPEVRFSLGSRIASWDVKREGWLRSHPTYAPRAKKRVVMVTGSQAKPCENPMGNHFLLRAFKNKVDYCRIHGYDIFYDTVQLHSKMTGVWAKLPVMKAAMIAHPEAEWIWWVDSDALITDMEYELPLDRYERKAHNVVVQGKSVEVFDKRNWAGLNTGVFLIRNCQWSMDFLEKWAEMGPMNSKFPTLGPIQRSAFNDKGFLDPDDRTGLAYILLQDPAIAEHVHLEEEYHLDGRWVDVVPSYSNISDVYDEIERGNAQMRRRHAEKVTLQYAAFREHHLRKAGNVGGDLRRPFVTHFTGCQTCTGSHNAVYKGLPCWDSIITALNFADNQVLRTFGFIHPNLLDSETVVEVAFNYPDDGPW